MFTIYFLLISGWVITMFVFVLFLRERKRFNEIFSNDLNLIDNIYIDIERSYSNYSDKYYPTIKTILPDGSDKIVWESNKHEYYDSTAKKIAQNRYDLFCMNFGFDKKTGLKRNY